MGMPAAKKGDQITAMDFHIILLPPLLTPALIPHPFSGVLDGQLSSDVNIMGLPAAVVGSTASNTPSHVPIGGTFQTPPRNQAKIVAGSAMVNINGKPAARATDTATTCNDPADLPVGLVVAQGTVNFG
jgi:uncharacterized Zn-binding protein involved in type VI secretion